MPEHDEKPLQEETCPHCGCARNAPAKFSDDSYSEFSCPAPFHRERLQEETGTREMAPAWRRDRLRELVGEIEAVATGCVPLNAEQTESFVASILAAASLPSGSEHEFDLREWAGMHEALRPYWIQQESMTAPEAIKRLVARVEELEASLPSGDGERRLGERLAEAGRTIDKLAHDLEGAMKETGDLRMAIYDAVDGRPCTVIPDDVVLIEAVRKLAAPAPPSGETGGGQPQSLRCPICGVATDDPEHRAWACEHLAAEHTPAAPPAGETGDGREVEWRRVLRFASGASTGSRPTKREADARDLLQRDLADPVVQSGVLQQREVGPWREVPSEEARA